MNFWLIFFLLGASKLLLVESRCTYHNLLRNNFDALCEKWWKKSAEYSYTSRPRRKCIQLIKKKCPNMLTFGTKITKSYNTNYLHYETWDKEVKATWETNWDGVAYDVFKKYPLCFDDGGRSVTCDFWWKVAREDRAENKDKEFCINQIRKYCKNDISFRDEVDFCDVQRCGSGYKIKKVTYKDKDGNTASFNRYVRVKK